MYPCHITVVKYFNASFICLFSQIDEVGDGVMLHLNLNSRNEVGLLGKGRKVHPYSRKGVGLLGKGIMVHPYSSEGVGLLGKGIMVHHFSRNRVGLFGNKGFMLQLDSGKIVKDSEKNIK